MKHLITNTFCLLWVTVNMQAQTDTIRYFQSFFETTQDRQQWTNVPSDNNKNWIFNSKGGFVNPGDGMNYNPDAAYEGTYNAFHVWSDFVPDVRKIVTIPFDLSDSKKPELSFAHAMFESVFGTNKLALLFKAGSSAPWDTILHFDTPIDEWTIHSLNIKDYGAKYLCKDFQLAFESKARGEFGVCIDSVIIEEKDIIIRYVKSVKIRHVAQSPIPSGASDIPVMRVDVNIVGNTDPMVLSSLVFNSISSHDSLFAVNGFELVATKDSSYQPTSKGASLKIGSPVSISNGTITFNSLNYNLSTGYNAIWLVADIKSTAPHKSTADFKVGAGAIHIGSNTYPSAEVSPEGSNTIEEAVFYDSFEGTSSWTLESDFEAAVPKGYAAYITEDPDFAYSGTKVMGTDLTVDGKYRRYINSPPNNYASYFATSPTVNLQYYTDVKLSFKKWIAFEGNDHGVIEVSTDNGTSWQKLWDNKTDGLTPDNDWVSYINTSAFNAIAAHKSSVKVRFGVIYTDNNFEYAGFNIDNFAITGNYLTNDVGIIDVIKPVDDCHNPGMDTVQIVVHNYADRETASSIPVFFSIDGTEGKRVFENIPGPIPSGDTITYTFTHTADFPSPGDYSNFTVKIQADGDEDPSNDTKTRGIFIQKSIGLPDYENFETGGGYWKQYGFDPRWLCKVPEGTVPPITGSPNCWISSPYGNYLTNDTSYLESSCYDLVSNGRSIFEMKLWMDSEPGHDGALVEYSTDNGTSWAVLPAHEFSWNWNWYEGNVLALGTQGWSGINSQNWKTVKQVIPAALSIEPKVKFRIKWASDSDDTYRGMAVDEVKLYPAPPDIGVSQIDSFASRCQNLNPDQVTVTIKNYGINSLKQNDTIVVGFNFDQVHVATDTFHLAADLLPGQTIKHTFIEHIDVSAPGNYNLTAYTLFEDDPWFYEGNNDTVSLDFTVYPGPLTSLSDTIQTHLPDTVVLTTIYNADYDYWWNGAGGSSTYNVQDAGWQYLKVTNTRGNGCSSYDSTNVELLFYDVGALELVHPTDDCGFSTHEYPVVRIKNYGTDSIASGQKIAIMVSMNAGLPVSDTLTLPVTLYSGRTIDFTFTRGAVDLSQQGTYSFHAATSYGGDTISINDTIIRSVEILGRPAVTLGPDITVEALSHTIDAGSGYTSYMWDNGEIGQTREVTSGGSYWVQVFDANHCDNYDTAYIWLKIRDLSPDGLAGPLSDCSYNTAEQVSLRILNSGTDTVPSGTSIAVSYRFQGGTAVNGNLVLTQGLYPNAFVTHTFPGTVNLGAAGDYSFEATVAIPGDLRPSNDTSTITVYRYDRPVVDFGLESTEYVEDVLFEIEAGYSPYYSYQWQDTATGHLYTATTSGLYHVTATDTRTLCYDRDSVWVFLIYGDVGVTWSDMPVNGCTGDFGNVRVRVQNLGPSVIGSSAPIYIACDVNGTRVTFDTLVRSANFNPGASLELTLSGDIAVSEGGISSVAFYTLYDADKKSENDTLVVEFDALPAPLIDFGDVNGYLNTDLPHQLDAGSGHKAYLWQDNSTGQTYTVTVNGTYTVTVTGQNDCQTTKTVMINISDAVDNITGAVGEVAIYPNPNHGLFNLSVEGDDMGEMTVILVNSQGQTVYIREFSAVELVYEQIDVQHLSRGVYYMLIQTDKQVYRGKMVIQ